MQIHRGVNSRCEVAISYKSPRSGGASLDHLIGAQPNRWGYGKAERLGGLEVQDHLEFCRQLHREIARLRAAQNAIDISGGATPSVYPINSVGKQTAFSGIGR